MPTYTVHQPPSRHGETESAPERFVFVRDGFHFWAFALTPLWLLWRQLWLAFVVYLAVAGVLVGTGLMMLGAASIIQFICSFILSLLIGFEAATIWRWTLSHRGWKMLGFVVGEDAEVAEQRFFAAWVRNADQRAGATPPAAPPPERRGAPSPSDVIGLFPQPETRK
jgi:Protein of unknown function (DUF2628)